MNSGYSLEINHYCVVPSTSWLTENTMKLLLQLETIEINHMIFLSRIGNLASDVG